MINLNFSSFNSFNKLFNEKKFTPFAKVDLKSEDAKVQSINSEVKELISLIEAKNFVTNEQLQVFIDAHAYAVVSKEVLAELCPVENAA